MTGIYKITINDYYIYIGQSVDIENRWSTHLTELKQNKKSYNKKFQSVFNKYPNSIKFEIIEECNTDELDNKEIYWIGYYRSYGTKHGLNMNLGGNSNRKFKTTEEAEAAELERRKKWYQDNKDKIKERTKQYHKQYYQDNIKELKVKFKQYYQDNIKELKVKFKQYYQDNIKELKVKFKQYRQDNKEKCKEYAKQYYQDNKKEIRVKFKEYDEQYRRQKGMLSRKERFEIRYNLNRQLTNKEWDTWCNTKNKGKQYAIKYLQSLPNLTFTLPTKTVSQTINN